MSTINLTERREKQVLDKKRKANNDETTPEELLKMALEDIKDGNNKILRVVIILVGDEGQGKESIDVYRCQMNRPEQIGYLTTATHQQIHKWHNGDSDL